MVGDAHSALATVVTAVATVIAIAAAIAAIGAVIAVGTVSAVATVAAGEFALVVIAIITVITGAAGGVRIGVLHRKRGENIVEVADGVVLLVALAWFDGTATTTHHAGISRIIAMTRLIVRRRDVKFIKQIGSHLARLCIVAGATARSRGAVVLAVGFGGLLAGDTRRAGRGCIGLGQRRDQSGHRVIRRRHRCTALGFRLGSLFRSLRGLCSGLRLLGRLACGAFHRSHGNARRRLAA